MLSRSVRTMSNRTLAAQRTRAIYQHMSASTKTGTVPSHSGADEAPVLFETVGQVKKYTLNRPRKLNSLDTSMLNLLRPYVEEWSQSKISRILVGTGVGRAFCAGGDVASVVEAASNDDTRHYALDFFKREFELDYMLAAVPQPYVAVMDGITMGGGVGLSVNANFRIATENTVFAMPETKIGYCPDVGASFFLSRVDGEVGTYLALTGETISGRDVFELGFATHFVPSRRIPALLERLSSLDRPVNDLIDATIEEASQEREAHEPPCSIVGAKRIALDTAFGHNKVEQIFDELEKIAEGHEDDSIRSWAADTVKALELRSPTSLKVALQALRRGKEMTLHQALQMELNIATAFCSQASTDFATGVKAVLVEKIKERPQWSPPTLQEVGDDYIEGTFFKKFSPEDGTAPSIALSADLQLEPSKTGSPMLYTLPTEDEIRQLVTGSHFSSGSTSLTEGELIQKLEKLRRGKMGIREKVAEVVSRRCVAEADDSGVAYLKWKN
ncbi:3-hydroxyisobutyryl-coenzyme A hydrolase [Irpex rosettiformis]|uniref:3-hydroxyisobutyryl-coenzyme A hydrolase n=1 Tax=Irpex rosettiformis TaxID=378272 RepID=A0ACB8UI89_9APHY|nr:3-hydroxyisobutyryl-coenzyme A hydrolase [Irpex rosettiformis]